MAIGERIKQRRLELGLTQTELAHRMGLTSKTTICKAETTDFNPTTDRVREFAKALETTPAFLMDWEEPSNSQEEKLARMVNIATEKARQDFRIAAKDFPNILLELEELSEKYGAETLFNTIDLLSRLNLSQESLSALENFAKSLKSDT